MPLPPLPEVRRLRERWMLIFGFFNAGILILGGMPYISGAGAPIGGPEDHLRRLALIVGGACIIGAIIWSIVALSLMIRKSLREPEWYYLQSLIALALSAGGSMTGYIILSRIHRQESAMFSVAAILVNLFIILPLSVQYWDRCEKQAHR